MPLSVKGKQLSLQHIQLWFILSELGKIKKFSSSFKKMGLSFETSFVLILIE